MKYTLAFDVYGTLINTSGVYLSLEQMIGEQAKAFMYSWRNKQLEYSFRRAAMDRFTDFSVCTKEALEYCCQLFNIDLSKQEREALMLEYRVLPIFPDVKEALSSLKAAGHRLFAFSNGSSSALHQLLGHAGISDQFEGIVSVEGVKIFKPSPKVYAYFNQQSQSTKSSSCLISGNSFDVLGALSYGMHAAWVQRSPDSVFDPWDLEPTLRINSLKELASGLEGLA